MERKQVSIAGSIDTATEFSTGELLGNTYTILPAVMMKEGSYYPAVDRMESPTCLHFTAESLRQSVNTWNGRPVAVNHPNNQVTCNNPETFNNQLIGYVFNARYDQSTTSLRADLWIDDKRGESVTSRVKAGDQIDVSIGAFGNLAPPRNKDTADFDYMMTDIIGDHLAVLPDGQGACSWKDGCGIRAYKHYVANVKGSARTPSFNGTETTSWGSVTKSLEAYIKGYKKAKGSSEDIPTNVADMPSEVKKWIASKTLLGDASADNSRDLIFFPVVNPSTNKLNEGALKAVMGGRGSQADIPSSAKESAKSKAESLLNKHFKKKSGVQSKMADCEERKEVKVESVRVEAAPRPMTIDDVMARLGDDDKARMIAALKSYDDDRKEYIETIVKCEKIKFNAEVLGRVKDNCLLKNVASLVKALDAKEEKAKEVAVAAEAKPEVPAADYGIRAASAPSQEMTWAPFKDLTPEDFAKDNRRRFN